MNRLRAGFAAFGLAALAAVAAMLDASPAQAQCSVFDRHPCNPSGCSVFQRRPCMPEFEYPIGQDLRLTIESVESRPPGKTVALGPDGSEVAAPATPEHEAAEHVDDDNGKDRKVNTILQLYAALRACWVPPPADEAREGMQMSVRFAFKRTGEIMGTPRVTYTTPNTAQDVRETYQHAITDSLTRCTPMPFTAGLGGAVAGRPINVRFVDNRKL